MLKGKENNKPNMLDKQRQSFASPPNQSLLRTHVKNMKKIANEEKLTENFEKVKIFAKASLFEELLQKRTRMRVKEIEKHKSTSLKLTIFIGLFIWLGVGVVLKNILFSAGISIFISAALFLLLLQIPLSKKKEHSTRVESDLPMLILRLAGEIKMGKNFNKAISDSCKEGGEASKEFLLVLNDMEKGASFQEALTEMNERMGSITIRRANSHLSNLNVQGTRDVSGLKKLAGELLLKQRIESKEFSGKMVVFALVFIAVSAIVPAIFQSFILIGSYFMKISFSTFQIFLISAVVFPLADVAILMMIDKKTPLFLKQ